MIYPSEKNWQSRDRTPTGDRPSAPQGNQCLISHFLASLEAQEQPDIAHIALKIAHKCCDQLTAVKTGIRWPISPYRIAGSGIDSSSLSIFLKLCAYKLLVFKWLQAQVYFFKFIWNKLCLCAALLKFWFQTDLGSENSTSCYREGRQLLLKCFTFLTMVTRWSQSTFNFYTLIGQN